MKLFEIDPVTHLPVPTAEARTIASLRELIKRIKPMPGDADGRQKRMNLMELAYVHFGGVFDSRFKLMDTEEREENIKRLIGLPKDWKPDNIVLQAIEDFTTTQWTESIPLVTEIQRSIMSLTAFAKRANKQVEEGGLDEVRAIGDYMDILDRIPKTVDSLKRAKETLNREQEALAKGRKGRALNKFELPD